MKLVEQTCRFRATREAIVSDDANPAVMTEYSITPIEGMITYNLFNFDKRFHSSTNRGIIALHPKFLKAYAERLQKE
jgi:hypothetical protein